MGELALCKWWWWWWLCTVIMIYNNWNVFVLRNGHWPFKIFSLKLLCRKWHRCTWFIFFLKLLGLNARVFFFFFFPFPFLFFGGWSGYCLLLFKFCDCVVAKKFWPLIKPVGLRLHLIYPLCGGFLAIYTYSS